MTKKKVYKLLITNTNMVKLKYDNISFSEITIKYENTPEIKELLNNYVNIQRSNQIIKMGDSHVLVGEPLFKRNKMQTLTDMESDFSQYGFRMSKGEGITEIELGKKYLSPLSQKLEDERIEARKERISKNRSKKGLEGKF